LQVEGNIVALAAEEKRPLLPGAVADAELVVDVGVEDRDVRNHQIGREQELEHVLADVPLPDDLARGAAAEVEGAQRRTDQLSVNPLEVDPVLRAEGPNDKGAHARGPRGTTPLVIRRAPGTTRERRPGRTAVRAARSSRGRSGH